MIEIVNEKPQTSVIPISSLDVGVSVLCQKSLGNSVVQGSASIAT